MKCLIRKIFLIKWSLNHRFVDDKHQCCEFLDIYPCILHQHTRK